MFNDFYGSFNSVIIALLCWWIVLLVFQRITNRYPKKNGWKKDITFTFFQSVFVIISLPILAYFIGPK